MLFSCMHEFNVSPVIIKQIISDQSPAAPLKATIDLTSHCQLHCAFCWFHAPLRRDRHDRQHIPTSCILHMIQELAAMGTRTICLSGEGDPTTHPAIIKIIDAIKKAGMSLSIFTNLTSNAAATIEALTRADHLAVNLSATNTVTYAQIHGTKNPRIYARVIKNIATIASSRTKQHHPHIEISHVLTRLNFNTLAQAIDLAQTHGASSIHFKHLQPTPYSKSLTLRTTDQKLLAQHIASLLKHPITIPNNLKDILKSMLRTQKTAPTNQRCFIGWFNIKIRQDNSVGLCCLNNKLKIGKYHQGNLKDLWTGARAQKIRKVAKSHLHASTPLTQDCQDCPYTNLNNQIKGMLHVQTP